jgi:integrase/recombinase XerD
VRAPPTQPSALRTCPRGVPTSRILDMPVAALEAHYRQRLSLDAPLRAQLASLGLAGTDGSCVPDVGLSTRQAATLIAPLRARDRRAARAAWTAAGLLRTDGRERFVGCLILPLPRWDGLTAGYAGLPRAALAAPGAGPQRRTQASPLVCTWRTVAEPTVSVICGDSFDALCCRVAGTPDVRLVEGPPEADWATAISACLGRRRPLRLRVLLPGTAGAAVLTDAILQVAATLALPCEVIALPPGCHLRDLRRLHGALAFETLLHSGTLQLPATVTTPPAVAPAHPWSPWAAAPGSLPAALSAYLLALQGVGRAVADLRQRARRLDVTRRTLVAIGVCDTEQLSAPVLAELQRRLLASYETSSLLPSRDATIRVLESLRLFLRWAAPRGLVPPDAATGLDTLRRHAVPPPLILSAAEVARALRTIPVQRPGGLRDRAMFELFYATGIRRVELVNLDVADVDAGRGLVRVRRGKGGTARLVPLGTRAGHWIARYVETVRVAQLRRADEPALFVTARGRRIGPKAVTARMRRCLVAAGIGKSGSCHVLRHTVATLMHEAGADIRDLQALLGHALLTSTQLYTRVSMRRLQEVHAATHPGERGG